MSAAFGDSHSQVAARLGQKLGLDPATVQRGLAMVVPIVMGYLAKQRVQGAEPSALAAQVEQHGDTDLLGSLMGGGGLGSVIGKILG